MDRRSRRRRQVWSGVARASVLAVLVGLVQVTVQAVLVPAQAVVAVVVDTPTLLHGNGARLTWRRSKDADFQRYDVHRGTAAGFAATDANRIAQIASRTTNLFTDNSAKGGTTYYYKVVVVAVSGKAASEVKADLPAAGTSRLLVTASAAGVDGATIGKPGTGNSSTCGTAANWGSSTVAGGGRRLLVDQALLLRFDLKDVPAKATITEAKLTLSYAATRAPTRACVAHRVNAARGPRARSPAAPAAVGAASAGRRRRPAAAGGRAPGPTRAALFDNDHPVAAGRRRAPADDTRDRPVRRQGPGPAVGQRPAQQRAAAQADHRGPGRAVPGHVLLRRLPDEQASGRCWTYAGPTPARTSARSTSVDAASPLPGSTVSTGAHATLSAEASAARGGASVAVQGRRARRSARTPPPPYAVQLELPDGRLDPAHADHRGDDVAPG